MVLKKKESQSSIDIDFMGLVFAFDYKLGHKRGFVFGFFLLYLDLIINWVIKRVYIWIFWMEPKVTKKSVVHCILKVGGIQLSYILSNYKCMGYLTRLRERLKSKFLVRITWCFHIISYCICWFLFFMRKICVRTM